ncbi:MAG TPA: hypothetical protein VGD29_03235 [Actinoplanes sp.]|jgi:hypothetical protein
MTRETDRDAKSENAGASTDQYITGRPETGDFIVDQPPTSTTPAQGSSNKGINDTRGNRPPDSEQPGG